MRKRLASVFLALVLVAAAHAQLTVVSASHLVDLSGNPVTGTLTCTATDAQGRNVNFVENGVQYLRLSYQGKVKAGSISFTVPSPSTSTPPVYYHITVTVPGSGTPLDYPLVTWAGNTFDLDNYSQPGSTPALPAMGGVVNGNLQVNGNVTITGTCTNCGGGGGGGGGNGVWGQITGTLANQADLYVALNAKQAALGFVPLNPANNLSELTSQAAARTSLGLGSAATQPTGAFDGAGTSAAETSRAETAESLLAPKTNPSLSGNVSIAGLADGCLNIASGIIGSTGLACGSGGGGIGYPAGTGIPQVVSGAAWAATYNASNTIPVNFLGIFSAGNNGFGTGAFSAAQVNSDWNAGSGVAQILNKPSIPAGPPYTESQITNLVSDLAGKQPLLGFTAENVANKSTDVTLGGGTPSDTKYPSQAAAKSYVDTGLVAKANTSSLAPVATSGAYGDLTGKPTIPTSCGGLSDAGSGCSTNVGTVATHAATDFQAALGFTPENIANKDIANGYAGLDSSGKLKTAEAPTWNQNTTGSAASLAISGQSGLLSFAGLLSTNRIKTVRDAADTILELGGTYTPTGTWDWRSASVTWPTFNQNTTGTSAGLTSQYVDWNASSGGPSIANKPSIPAASSTTPAMDGAGAAGSSGTYARADHVHPTDASLAPKANPTFTGQAAFGNGTEALPGITFSYDTDDGFYMPSNGVLGIPLQAHEFVRLDGSNATSAPANYYFGIGTKTCNKMLCVGSGNPFTVDSSGNVTAANLGPGATTTFLAMGPNPTVLTSSMVIFGPTPMTQAVTVPANGANSTGTSQFILGTLPTATWTATIYKVAGSTAGCTGTATSMGTVAIATSGAQTWSTSATTFAIADCIKVVAPSSVDTTAANPVLSLVVVK